MPVEPGSCENCGGPIEDRRYRHHVYPADCFKYLAGRVAALETKAADHGARIAELEAKNDYFLQQVKDAR